MRTSSVTSVVLRQVLVHHLQPLEHVERSAQGAGGIILVRVRDAERSHHGIADELLDRSAFGLDLCAHRREECVHDLAHPFGIQPLAKGRRARDVGEQDRHELALAPPSLSLRHRGPAVRTEASAMGKVGGADRTDRHGGECIAGAWARASRRLRA